MPITRNAKFGGRGTVWVAFRFRYEDTGNANTVDETINAGGSALISSISRAGDGDFTVTLASGFRPQQLISGVAQVEGNTSANLAWVDADSFSASAGTFKVYTSLHSAAGTPAEPADEAIINCIICFQEYASLADT